MCVLCCCGLPRSGKSGGWSDRSGGCAFENHDFDDGFGEGLADVYRNMWRCVELRVLADVYQNSGRNMTKGVNARPEKVLTGGI